MTKRETAKAIKILGLNCQWSTEWQEFTVDYRRDDPRFKAGDSGSSYHTADADDALDTARAMAQFRSK